MFVRTAGMYRWLTDWPQAWRNTKYLFQLLTMAIKIHGWAFAFNSNSFPDLGLLQVWFLKKDFYSTCFGDNFYLPLRILDHLQRI